MEIIKKEKSEKMCLNVCLLDNKNQYLLVTDFMLGDADGDKTVIQWSGKKITKEANNLIMALEVLDSDVSEYNKNRNMGEYLEIPYSEYSYYSFQEYKLIFLDKDGNIFKCNINFDENEKNIINSFKLNNVI